MIFLFISRICVKTTKIRHSHSGSILKQLVKLFLIKAEDFRREEVFLIVSKSAIQHPDVHV